MTSPTHTPTDVSDLVNRYAARMAHPQPVRDDEVWRKHSLTRGAVGIALLHIERAHTGHTTWHHAHSWIRHTTAAPISATGNTGLYQGIPAVTFALHTAAGTTERYRAALTELDTHIRRQVDHRTASAAARMRQGIPAHFREYDIFFGLTGIGALLLLRDPGGYAMERVLRYLVALSRPLRTSDGDLPGWWVAHDPYGRASRAYPGGHGNFGIAHGIAGPLALLGHAQRRGITVDGQAEAITSLAAWFDRWRRDSHTGPWWPEWITTSDLRSARPSQTRPGRPGWCYGTPGIARALQVAAIATNDPHLRQAAEDALVRCLDDPVQQARITDAGLCHGWAGVHQTLWRAARDASTPALAARLPQVTENLLRHADPDTAPEPGFLNGAAGTALALQAINTPPTSGWDTCLALHA